MERIFISRLIGLLSILFSCSVCFAQQSYFVFKKVGKPSILHNKVLEKGSLITASDTLHLEQNDYVLFVNEHGDLFEITQANTYTFAAIADFKRRIESDSFTKKYFAYVWKQFTNSVKSKQRSGVVYREERKVKLVSPGDSVKLYAPVVQFKWQNNTEETDLYFFLKDMQTGHLTKMGLTGSRLELSLDNFLLKSGQTYKWSVTSNAFPNLNELKFNALNIVTKEEYEKLKLEMTVLIRAFTLLGFSETEIQEAICLDYKFCTF